MTLWINHQPSGGKEWVAEIVGLDAKYGLARRFLRPVDRRWSGSGKTGDTAFELEEGAVYEVNEPWRGRRFVVVRDGKAVHISRDDVMKLIQTTEVA